MNVSKCLRVSKKVLKCNKTLIIGIHCFAFPTQYLNCSSLHSITLTIFNKIVHNSNHIHMAISCFFKIDYLQHHFFGCSCRETKKMTRSYKTQNSLFNTKVQFNFFNIINVFTLIGLKSVRIIVWYIWI